MYTTIIPNNPNDPTDNTFGFIYQIHVDGGILFANKTGRIHLSELHPLEFMFRDAILDDILGELYFKHQIVPIFTKDNFYILINGKAISKPKNHVPFTRYLFVDFLKNIPALYL